ncbi:MAG: lactonase family protein [Dehalococcoidia bacterium]|nr:lactonase family protein [Dehalococcoidia bacterium]
MPTFVYVTASGDDKILIFGQDEDSGALERLGDVDAEGRPAPLATDPEARFLYVARRDVNKLSSYSIDPVSGGLELLGVVDLDSDPNYLATDKTGRWLLSAYYIVGRCAVNPIDDSGVAQSPPVEWRATGPGAHSMQTDATNRFAFVPHIGGGNGVNAIFQFLFDEETGTLTPNDPARVSQDGDLGPRHYCFHPSLDVVYFSNEQGCSVTAYNFDSGAGTLSAFQTISTLPALWSGRNSCAQIRINPSGTMLFAPNRGHDSIACFRIDSQTGRLTRTAIVPSEAVPRALNVDPQGRFLYAAGLDSGKLAAYEINEAWGGIDRIGTFDVGREPMWVLPVSQAAAPAE